MEKLSFISKIVSVDGNGFSAILEDNYLIKWKDSKLKHNFNVGDKVKISIENSESIGREDVRSNYLIAYCILNSFLSNGFMFRDTGEQKSWYQANRGLVTFSRFEDEDIFQENDILKIVIRKLYI